MQTLTGGFCCCHLALSLLGQFFFLHQLIHRYSTITSSHHAVILFLDATGSSSYSGFDNLNWSYREVSLRRISILWPVAQVSFVSHSLVLSVPRTGIAHTKTCRDWHSQQHRNQHRVFQDDRRRCGENRRRFPVGHRRQVLLGAVPRFPFLECNERYWLVAAAGRLAAWVQTCFRRSAWVVSVPATSQSTQSVF